MNTTIDNLTELSETELINTDGGVVAWLALTAGAFYFGFGLGKEYAQRQELTRL